MYFLIESGYTPNERLRFSEIIKEGCLVDSYRHFNPVPSSALKEDIPSHSYDDDNSGTGWRWSHSYSQEHLSLFETLFQLLVLRSLFDCCFSNWCTLSQSLTGTLTVLDPLGPNYTWRGAAGVQISEAGRFYGKGMRIDYAMVSESILSAVKSVEILGNCSSVPHIKYRHLLYPSLSLLSAYILRL